MNQKLKVGIIFGGRSAEHEVSLQSAQSIIDAIDKAKFDIFLIGIDKSGKWALYGQSFLDNATDPKNIRLAAGCEKLGLVPGDDSSQLARLDQGQALDPLDVVFPILHGPFGEDGTMQGLLKLFNLPFVGPGVLGSAVSMDKDVMKRLLRDAGVRNARFMTFHKHQQDQVNPEEVKNELGFPVFIKPANMGSSVGVNKARNEAEFKTYLAQAFQFDHKVIVEEFIKGREIECAVLGNENPEASIPGEIQAHHEFYSYEAKYIDEKGANLIIPADLPADIVKKVQAMAIKTFQVLCCEGLGRVDMFVTDNNEIYVNEINTIPGFTKISMYPKLWEHTGIPYQALITRLLELAIQRYEREQQLKINVEF
ncbi:MAG: D-alanine--D-alanine ligase [Candidatus Cyclobacteriaceae bacterium M3_2C_046]